MLELDKFRVGWERLYRFPIEPKGHRALLAALFWLLFTIILSADFLTDKVSLRVGQVSEREIVVPRTESYVNKAKTRQLEAEVAAGVATAYDLDVLIVLATQEVGNVFIRVLSSMYHKRVEYPEAKDVERRKHKNGYCVK